MSSLRVSLLGLSLLGACAHVGPAPSGPEGTVRAYAEALQAGRLDEAFGLSHGVDRDAFADRYHDPAVRQRRAAQLLASAEGAPGGDDAVNLVLLQGRWRVQERQAATATVQLQARQALQAFLDAAEAGRFEQALGLLSARWRGRYTVQRFKDDFGKEPLAAERLQRARAALDGAWSTSPSGAELSVGAGKVVRLAAEPDGYRVVSLE